MTGRTDSIYTVGNLRASNSSETRQWNNVHEYNSYDLCVWYTFSIGPRIMRNCAHHPRAGWQQCRQRNSGERLFGSALGFTSNFSLAYFPQIRCRCRRGRGRGWETSALPMYANVYVCVFCRRQCSCGESWWVNLINIVTNCNISLLWLCCVDAGMQWFYDVPARAAWWCMVQNKTFNPRTRHATNCLVDVYVRLARRRSIKSF